MRLAEKRLNETDIVLNTPMGVLAFTRKYRQSQQADLDFMGLGWTHNHRYSLVEDGGTPNKITVNLAGNTVVFYDDNADDIFEGAAGSASVIVKDGSGEYDLTASDESVYHFNSNAQLETHTLSTGDVWSFSYDGSGKLTEVSDGYGRSLKFVYYSGLTGADAFKNDQLWRVGTHASTDLVNSPQDPYIELDYTDDGNGDALLTDVQDVRGKAWTYRYYGSEAGETDTKWTNFLVERFSPTVDTDGDSSPDGTITLESLLYTGTARDAITGITQDRGDALETRTLAFNAANGSTTETVASRTLTHQFTNEVYAGMKDPANNEQAQPSLSNYRPAYQEDAKGNRTGMKWSADGKRLEGVVDAAYNETAFAYDAQDRLVQSTDAEGRITVYSYSQDERQPAEIITAQPESDLAINGDMELNYAWAGLNVPTSQARSDEQVAAGNYAWKVVADQGEGIESASDITFSEGKLYLLLAQVYVLNSGDSVTMGVANSSDWDATTETDGRWETLHALHKVTTMGGLTEKIQFSANHASTTFYVDAVQVLELSDVRWQQFVYDSQGRTLEEHVLDPTDGSALRSVEREYGTSGTENGLLQKITQKNVEALGIEETETEYVYDAQGRVIKTCKSSLMGTCSFTYTVYDEAGNVLGTACAVVNVTAPTTVEDLQKLYDATDDKKKLTRVTTHTYDALGRKISTITDNGEDSIFARENLTFYDALGRIVRTVQNYNAQSSAPGAWVYRAVSGEYAWRLSNTDDTVVSHG
ncbi:MAG: DUF6531 domain-containing protein, partial [Chloroflexota bacterium]